MMVALVASIVFIVFVIVVGVKIPNKKEEIEGKSSFYSWLRKNKF